MFEVSDDWGGETDQPQLSALSWAAKNSNGDTKVPELKVGKKKKERQGSTKSMSNGDGNTSDTKSKNKRKDVFEVAKSEFKLIKSETKQSKREKKLTKSETKQIQSVKKQTRILTDEANGEKKQTKSETKTNKSEKKLTKSETKKMTTKEKLNTLITTANRIALHSSDRLLNTPSATKSLLDQSDDEESDLSGGGHLLSKGVRFTSQAAFLRFIGMPGKKSSGKKRLRNEMEDEYLNNGMELNSSNLQIDDNFQAKISCDEPLNDNSSSPLDKEDNPSPPPIPPPRKKRRKDGIDRVKLKELLNQEENVVEMKTDVNSIISDDKKVKKTLAEEAKLRLSASRFRYLNEQLYSQPGSASAKMFKTDSELFSSYHSGYQLQAKQWPIDPLDIIISDINSIGSDKIIADFGCGEARLAASVDNMVHSFDLVSANPRVTACDIANTPLEKSSVDVVVFCLSLMGTNLRDFLFEAGRVMKMNGNLKIAELESRFQSQETEVQKFIEDVQKFGFELYHEDLKKEYFYFLDFTKVREIAKKKKLPDVQLKACLYKKR